MWLFTTRGVFCVETAGKGRLVVASYTERDVRELANEFDLGPVLEEPGRELPHSVIVMSSTFQQVARKIIADVDYQDFISEVGDAQGKERAVLYQNCFTMLRNAPEESADKRLRLRVVRAFACALLSLALSCGGVSSAAYGEAQLDAGHMEAARAETPSDKAAVDPAPSHASGSATADAIEQADASTPQETAEQPATVAQLDTGTTPTAETQQQAPDVQDTSHAPEVAPDEQDTSHAPEVAPDTSATPLPDVWIADAVVFPDVFSVNVVKQESTPCARSKGVRCSVVLSAAPNTCIDIRDMLHSEARCGNPLCPLSLIGCCASVYDGTEYVVTWLERDVLKGAAQFAMACVNSGGLPVEP